jgi:hypothetical protein
MTRSSPTARMGASLLAVLLAAACSDTPVAPTAQLSPAAPPTLSRVATPSSNRHILDLSAGIPSDLAAQVAAKGGTLVR